MQQARPYLSVVVPLYNEEGNVIPLHTKIKDSLDAVGRSYEIIFINDGSKDNTLAEARVCHPVRIIDFRKNYGQTAAFDAGFKAARGDVVITMDGDLQNDPADIPNLLAKIDEGYDVVSGWRHKRQDPWSKKIPSRIANALRKVLINDTIHDSGCSLKAYRRECFKHVDLFGEMHRFIPAVLELQGFKVGEVKVGHHPRIHGVTKYNWKRGVKGFADMISIWFWRKYAHRPLHLFGAMGFASSFVGFAILVWMTILKLAYHASLSERIWPMVGIFLVIMGMQLFIAGLLADILIRIYYRVQGRMNYAIREVIEQ
jgi:glycosyltransferase involved in cell wall biosynthesis